MANDFSSQIPVPGVQRFFARDCLEGARLSDTYHRPGIHAAHHYVLLVQALRSGQRAVRSLRMLRAREGATHQRSLPERVLEKN